MDEAVEQGRQAAILFNQQEYVKSLAAISRSISLNSELKRDSALGESYLLLALCHRKVGQYDSSLSAFNTSLQYFHLVGDQRLERRGRIALADLYYELGRFRDAYSLASDAAGEAKVFSDAANLTHALLLVAKTSRKLQDYPRDAAALEELSHTEGREISNPDLMKLKFRSAVAARDPERTRDAFERWKSAVGGSGDSSGLAETYAAWGSYQLSLNHPDSALKAYSESLSMIGGIASRGLQTQVLTALGTIAYRSGRYDNAKLYFQEAQSLARQTNDIVGEQLIGLIMVACDWKNGRTSQSGAPELVKRCSDVSATCRQCGLRMGDMFAQFVKGSIQYRGGDTAGARVSFTEALRLDDQNISPDVDQYPVFTVIDAFLATERSSWSDPLLQLYAAQSNTGELFKLTEQDNLRDIQDLFSRSALKTDDLKIDHASVQLHLERNALKLLEQDIYEELSSGKGRNLERINLLNKLYPERLQEISVAAKALDGTNLQWLLFPRTIALETVRDTMPPNSALMEFVPLPNELRIIVVTKDSSYVRSVSITRDRLLGLVDEYQRLIGDPRLNTKTPNFNEASVLERIQELSSVLYNILIEPAMPYVGGAGKVYIVPPQSFGWFPFHTLRSGGGAVVTKFAVNYLPSAAALFFQSKKEKPVSDVIGLGHAGKTGWDVEYELKDIRSFFDKTKMLFDTAATIEHLKYLPCDILHVDAEFDLDLSVPENSAVVLSDGATPYGLRPVQFGSLLTVPYPPVLVFSNISPVPGALSRYAPMLFLAGGSHTVIATMWQGERKAKKYFGEVFYTNVMSNVSASTAYQQAMVAMATNSEYSRPHRWGLYYQFGR